MLTHFLIVFIISMIPVLELRAAIPVAIGFQLPIFWAYVVCIIGNMLPVPFIFFFARKVLVWGSDKPLIGNLFSWFLKKGENGGEKLLAKAGRSTYVALFLFVGIPLPGTGAWTGTLAASILNLDFRKSVIAALCGVLLAGVIMGTASAGVFGLIRGAI